MPARASHHAMRRGALALSFLVLASLGACKSAGGVGDILSSVLGGGGAAQSAQLAGTITAVDTRNLQLGIQQSNGQTVGVSYDDKTKVVYQERAYTVTSLEPGDQVVARVVDRGNGAYYTDSVQVTASVQSTGAPTTSGASGSVQQLQGTVRQVDRNNGLFALDMQGTTVTVSVPYGARSADVTRFQNLRVGEQVRITGVFLNNTRVELRSFY